MFVDRRQVYVIYALYKHMKMAEKNVEQVGDFDIFTDEKLGSGSFGSVYKGKHCTTGQNVVAKVITVTRENKEYVEGEIAILKLGKRNKNIVKILFDELIGHEMWIVMEECDLGNLAQYAMKNPMDLYTKIHIMHQCAQALVCLLNLKPQRVIHRDLKPANILLMSGDGITAKLSDFGVSKRVSTTATKLNTGAGSHHFMAPEMFDSNDEAMYSRAVDVFSLAVILWYLFKVKVGDNMDSLGFLGASIGSKMFIFSSEGIKWSPVEVKATDSEEVKLVKQLMEQMLQFDPTERPPMEEVMEMLATIKEGLKQKASSPVSKDVSMLAKDLAKALVKRQQALANPKQASKSMTSASTTKQPQADRRPGASPQPPSSPSTAKPAFVTNKPRINKLHNLTLGYKANITVGFGNNSVFLGVDSTKKMVQFNINEKITESWQKNLPSGVKYYCYKHVTDSTLAIRNYNNNPTLVMDQDLRPISRHEGEYGYVRAVLPGGRLLYARLISGRITAVDIYQLPQHNRVTTLTRPGEPYRYVAISACCHPHSQWMAVVDGGYNGSCTLDIYDDKYQHQTHVTLGYRPLGINAVAHVKDYIIIVDYDSSLHVYNWAGQEVCVWDTQQLGVEEGDRIYGIGAAGQHKLVLAAGGKYDGGVASLHLYDVV